MLSIVFCPTCAVVPSCELVQKWSDEQFSGDFTRRTRRSLLVTSVLLLAIACAADLPEVISVGVLKWKLHPYLVNLLPINPIHFVALVAFFYSLLQWRLYATNDFRAVTNKRHEAVESITSDLQRKVEQTTTNARALEDWLEDNPPDVRFNTLVEYQAHLGALPEPLLSSGKIPMGTMCPPNEASRDPERLGREYLGLRRTVENILKKQVSAKDKLQRVIEQLTDLGGQDVWVNYRRRMFFEFKFPWWIAVPALLLFLARLSIDFWFRS